MTFTQPPQENIILIELVFLIILIFFLIWVTLFLKISL
jgi:hypothetical protein